MFDTIPSFTKIKHNKKRKVSAATAKVYARAKICKAEKELQQRLAAEVVKMIDLSKPKKLLILETRQAGLSYKWIAKIINCSYGYVRNLCSDMDMRYTKGERK